MPLATSTSLREHQDEIVRRWEALLAADPGEIELAGSVLRNHVPKILDELANWLDKGDPAGAPRLSAIASAHSVQRLDQSFRLAQIMQEYRLLRTAILAVLLEEETTEQARAGESGNAGKATRVVELARLNAGLEWAISDAVEHFVAERDRRLAVMRSAERRYADLITLSPDAVFVNRDDRVEFVNPSALALFGASLPEELIGKPVIDLFRPQLHDLIRERIAHLQGGYRREPLVEEQIVRVDGSVRDVEVAAASFEDERGRAIQVILRDATFRKRMEHALRTSEEQLRLALEAAHMGTFDTDLATLTVTASDSTFRLFGMPPSASAPLAAFLARIHPDDRAQVEDAMRRATAGDGATMLEYRVIPPEGSTRWVHVRADAHRASDGQVLSLRGVLFDVTARREAEDALRDADRRKTDFLAILSHELRNPLAPICNAVQLLRHAAPGSREALRAHEIIARQVDQLTRLVDDLLDISRINHGKITLRRATFDARDVVLRVCDDLQPSFDERGVALRRSYPADPLWIDADAARFAQIVTNLLTNAVKFTPKSGAVDVELVERAGRCELVVRDTGAGIEPELLEHVFEPFAQAERTRGTARGGMGIGLALVKSLVEMHGGRVRAQSEGPGRGAELIVTLPLVPAPERAVEARAAADAPKLSVLIVEDNRDAGETLADILTLDGHQTRLALDGQEGLAAFAESTPDLVLCDLGLPDLTGYEVIRQIRRLPGGSSVFAVALSGYAQPEDVEQAKRAGFDVHLPKPPALARLSEVLAQAAAKL